MHKDSGGRGKIHAPLLQFGFKRGLLKDLLRRLATEESALVIQAPIASLRQPVAFLRESGENPPLIFVLNPGQAGIIDDLGTVATPLAPIQIQERATPLVEWILDNRYIIDGSMRDVQQNLSLRFYRELPVLNDERHQGLPRIYGLARQIVSDTSLRLDRETIVAFVEAYQSADTRRTAELWAIPQMLRLALVEGIVARASRGLTDLRDREIADYWANRLITAGRRDPNHLFLMMAELTDCHVSPSPHFAFQLVGDPDSRLTHPRPRVPRSGRWLRRRTDTTPQSA